VSEDDYFVDLREITITVLCVSKAEIPIAYSKIKEIAAEQKHLPLRSRKPHFIFFDFS